MQYPTKDFVKDLLNKEKDTTKVSIFIPTHPKSNSANLNEDRIRFKNAVSEATEELEKRVRKKTIDKICKHLNRLYDDVDFWKHLSRTLVVFVNKNELTYKHLDIEVEQNVHVGNSYFTLPLLAVIDRKTDYYTLDVNLENPRLFKGNRYKFEEILKDEIPQEMEGALRIDEHQKQLQHSAVSSTQLNFHGHGGAKDKSDIDIANYLKKLDTVIKKNELHNNDYPLILAGSENTLNKFKRISQYKNIHPKFIKGNHQNSNLKQLHDKSWSVMLDSLSKEQKEQAKQMEKLVGKKSDLVLTDISHIEKAVEQGRVDTLMIEMISETNDSVLNRVVEAIKLKPFSKMTGEKLSQLAEDTFKQSGRILPLNISQLPTKTTKLAAILRY